MDEFNRYVLFKNIKEIDLHGMNRYEASIAVKSFIEESVILGDEFIRIIHGKGEGILKKAINQELKQNHNVKTFGLDYYNSGATIVLLYKKKN